MATNERRKDRTTGESVDVATWFRVTGTAGGGRVSIPERGKPSTSKVSGEETPTVMAIRHLGHPRHAVHCSTKREQLARSRSHRQVKNQPPRPQSAPVI